MSVQLGTIDELPAEYLDQVTAQNAKPLWPIIRDILPYGRPINRTVRISGATRRYGHCFCALAT